MKNFKVWLNIVVFVLFITFVFWQRDKIGDAFSVIRESSNSWRIWLLVLVIPVQMLSYYSVSGIYYSYFKNTKKAGALKMKVMNQISLELNFINSILPSGGISGFAYLVSRLKKYKIDASTATFAQNLRYVLVYLTYLVILCLGIIILAFDTSIKPMVILLSCFALFTSILLLIGLAWLVDKEDHIKLFVTWLPKQINKVQKSLARIFIYRHKIRKDLISIPKIEKFLGDMHAHYHNMLNNILYIKKPFFWALAANFFEILTIYIVFLGLGIDINPGAIIIAYGFANFAGLIAILPGGVGVYEPLMALGLGLITGIDGELALAGTIVYRILNFVIFTPVGYFYYHLAFNRQGIKSFVNKISK